MMHTSPFFLRSAVLTFFGGREIISRVRLDRQSQAFLWLFCTEYFITCIAQTRENIADFI